MNDVKNIKVELIALDQLKPADRNPRVHSKKQIGQIVRSMKQFGFTNPLMVDDQNQIIAGHGRLAAAKELGLKSIPCIRLSALNPAQRRGYLIADNKIALNASWDIEALALEFGDLLEMDFEVDLTGFEQPEVDKVMYDVAQASTKHEAPEDACPPTPSASEVVTRSGDHWTLGRHALLCGDAKDPTAIDALMGNAKTDMVFIDPPYNVRIKGNVSGKGRHGEFAEASGEMSRAEFTEFLTSSFQSVERACRSGAIVYVCMDWRHLEELLAAGYAVFTHLMNLCVWAKTNGGMGTFYRSQHELIFVWKVGDDPHTNNFGLGDAGRYRTNVWSYAGVNTFKAEREEELAMHPTVKPVALVADAIRDVSNRGQSVLDVFGGSGTTLIAAEKTGRIARLMELDPAYCDVTIRRWEKLTGKSAVLLSSGADFASVEADRLPKNGWALEVAA
ncbi:site-specific DNA-methyltransferase [Roseibium sp.]|uniref:site-specific DNA-methyltransferase n=1 Tax=Roseibium sp. TaxID=1936156 RepID=UPI00329A49F4